MTSAKMIEGVVTNGQSSGVGLQDGGKKIVRHYEGVNPEVEAELEKVIEELQTKGLVDGIKEGGEGIQVADE